MARNLKNQLTKHLIANTRIVASHQKKTNYLANIPKRHSSVKEIRTAQQISPKIENQGALRIVHNMMKSRAAPGCASNYIKQNTHFIAMPKIKALESQNSIKSFNSSICSMHHSQRQRHPSRCINFYPDAMMYNNSTKTIKTLKPNPSVDVTLMSLDKKTKERLSVDESKRKPKTRKRRVESKLSKKEISNIKMSLRALDQTTKNLISMKNRQMKLCGPRKRSMHSRRTASLTKFIKSFSKPGLIKRISDSYTRLVQFSKDIAGKTVRQFVAKEQGNRKPCEPATSVAAPIDDAEYREETPCTMCSRVYKIQKPSIQVKPCRLFANSMQIDQLTVEPTTSRINRLGYIRSKKIVD